MGPCFILRVVEEDLALNYAFGRSRCGRVIDEEHDYGDDSIEIEVDPDAASPLCVSHISEVL